MKKIFIVLGCLLLCFCSLSFASSEYLTDNNYLSKDIFEYILFDYNYLTKNDSETSRMYFKELSSKMIATEINFIQSIDVDKKNVKDTVLYIQENYSELTSKMNEYNKAILDKYLLKQALTYYYSILGKNFKYLKTNDITTNVMKADENFRSSTVASIKLYADDTERLLGSSGLNIDVGTHAWITVTNITISNITIGNITVPSAQSATIGTWGNKTEHIGIWYNLEGIFTYPSTTKELTYLLTQNELNALNVAIRTNSNDTWTELNNCSSFATRMWNIVGPDKISAGIINNPKSLAQNIMGLGGRETAPRTSNLSVYYNGNNPQLSQIFN